jgi:mono/diheme cytochrome c family protein
MRTALLLALILASVLPSPATAGDDEAAERGELLFQVHCRSCHGTEGGGDGALAEFLQVPPTDLTRLAEASGGELEREAVHRKIDGRDEVRGHGSSEMPVWGLSFQSAGLDIAQEDEVRARIDDLVSYLATIQTASNEDQPDER